MEKKNTILLTVIAVTTLLVAVVGATFAYYSVQHVDSTKTITFTGEANHVGAITLTSPVTTLRMTITPTDMAQFGEDKHYYAIVSEDQRQNPTTSVGFYGTARKNHLIALASLVGGNEETAYTCTATLTVTTSGTMASLLQEGDAYLYLDAEQTTIDSVNNQKLDLSKINNSPKTYSIVYTVNGTSNDNRQAHIYADIELNNSNTKDQHYLAGADLGVTGDNAGSGTAGSSLTVTISSDQFHCTIDKVKA